ncbi:hypothetical protein LTR37_011985 [Vermiconidia calcicola]|uniref:Uncharacterized protein n=1 Tax=Vermiconidia calcicola TaxID=1690605 RepID=A0ACC3N3B0_9PEZI|nr:hypothetical protein LTR37_011985 [Vermiconidia calcicola]
MATPQISALVNKLPAELRNHIYRLVLVRSQKIGRTYCALLSEPALLATCRQIRTEALAIYYSENVFHLNIPTKSGRNHIRIERNSSVNLAWLASLARKRCEYITRIDCAVTRWTRGHCVGIELGSNEDALRLFTTKISYGFQRSWKQIALFVALAELGVDTRAVRILALDPVISLDKLLGVEVGELARDDLLDTLRTKANDAE